MQNTEVMHFLCLFVEWRVYVREASGFILILFHNVDIVSVMESPEVADISTCYYYPNSFCL